MSLTNGWIPTACSRRVPTRIAEVSWLEPTTPPPRRSNGEVCRRRVFLAWRIRCRRTKYAFIPTAGKFEGVRSFAEQVKHVHCAIRLLQRIRRQEAAPTAKMGQIPRAPGGA